MDKPIKRELIDLWKEYTSDPVVRYRVPNREGEPIFTFDHLMSWLLQERKSSNETNQ